ncbi:hypothetical protein IHE51_00670 [Candidatus Parvarchaeota archaeon]|uniref:Uncharacterized protein n=1 Tax=Candidatus Acidifodinimicrobium mancum TaxID=2898728 RepID=A0A8T3UUX6_9ARCH|nr:hypothetical protein [Candidatus Acidifodinimicrobium mancum]MBE5728357.1 hypothetical protein [Candidatus Acidifodinimicrobium mancum]MBE5728819.1 hypothetical protein [Candidatus Acidifodinimicrobium mancum]MBE5730058.1 hypothetical protein [Candidatus Acidifodinimicrobium mancum]
MKAGKARELYKSEYMISIAALVLGILFLALTLFILYNFLSFTSSGSITISKNMAGYMLSEMTALIVVSALLIALGLIFIYRSRRELRR